MKTGIPEYDPPYSTWAEKWKEAEFMSVIHAGPAACTQCTGIEAFNADPQPTVRFQ